VDIPIPDPTPAAGHGGSYVYQPETDAVSRQAVTDDAPAASLPQYPPATDLSGDPPTPTPMAEQPVADDATTIKKRK